jgi:hypothetical protein
MLEHLWCSDKPRVTLDSQNSPQPGFEGSHHLPSYSILCTSLQGLHPNGFSSQDSRQGVPKLPRLELPQLCGAITSRSNLQLGRVLKQSYSSRWELFNDVSHATCMHGSWINLRHFVVESQTVNKTLSLSFCHNLCYRCPNGSCEPILDIYTLIVFQWHKELFNVRCFDFCNRSMKVRESTGTQLPKWEIT